MRMMIEIDFPTEPFNQLLRDGKIGPALDMLLGEIKPEAVYFRERNGLRACTMIVDMTDTAQMPAIAEPFFLMFAAKVDFEPVMTPEDLGRSGLDALAAKYP